MFDHQQLQIWHRSQTVAIDIHLAMRKRTRFVPNGLVAQLSRSCSSISSNIAEAAGQESAKQSAHYIDIAMGSLTETQSHLHIASATGLVSKSSAAKLIDELGQIRRMTFAFKKWLLREQS